MRMIDLSYLIGLTASLFILGSFSMYLLCYFYPPFNLGFCIGIGAIFGVLGLQIGIEEVDKQ